MVALPRRNQAPRASRIATRTVDTGDRKSARSRGSAERGVQHVDRRSLALREEADAARLGHAAALQAISHDLRNPLNVITMTAQLLQTKIGADQPNRRQVDMIFRSARELEAMLNDVSDLGKITSGRLMLNGHVCRPAEMIEQALAVTRPLAESRSIRIATEIADDLPALVGDRDRLVKILADLVTGALKATRNSGSITVRVAPDRGGALFSVTDSGPGIPEEDRPHVFTIPVAPLGEHPPTIQGANLPFHVAQGIIEAHGGRMWVESEVGQGSTFSFSLPASDEEPADDKYSLSAPSTA